MMQKLMLPSKKNIELECSKIHRNTHTQFIVTCNDTENINLLIHLDTHRHTHNCQWGGIWVVVLSQLRLLICLRSSHHIELSKRVAPDGLVACETERRNSTKCFPLHTTNKQCWSR